MFRAADQFSFPSVFHNTISADNAQCSSSRSNAFTAAYSFLENGIHIPADLLRQIGEVSISRAARNRFLSPAAIGDGSRAFFATDKTAKECGAFRFPERMLVIFFASKEVVELPQLGFLNAGRKHLVLVAHQGSRVIAACAYTAPLAFYENRPQPTQFLNPTPSSSTSPTPSRTPSRSPSPSRSSKPTPSQTPSRSPTPSRTPTPTPSRTPTPTPSRTPSRSPTPSTTPSRRPVAAKPVVVVVKPSASASGRARVSASNSPPAAANRDVFLALPIAARASASPSSAPARNQGGGSTASDFALALPPQKKSTESTQGARPVSALEPKQGPDSTAFDTAVALPPAGESTGNGQGDAGTSQQTSGSGNGAQTGGGAIAIPLPAENETPPNTGEGTTVAVPIQLPPSAGEGDGTGASSGQTNETSPTATPTGASACFPAFSLADTPLGRVPLASLRVGDLVHVGGGAFSRVYMFTHRELDGLHSFVKLRTTDGRVARMSDGHLTYASGRLVAARDVRVGDTLERDDGTRVAVASVARERGRGLMNPHTDAGDIVVDGFRASTFTKAVPYAPAQAALAPARALHASVGVWTRALERGSDSFVGWLLLSVARRVF